MVMSLLLGVHFYSGLHYLIVLIFARKNDLARSIHLSIDYVNPISRVHYFQYRDNKDEILETFLDLHFPL